MEENEYVRNGLARQKLEKTAELKTEKIVQVCGLDFFIRPNVFDPDIFPSARFIARPWVKLIQELKPYRVLEIGSAAGYNGILAALNGAHTVVCTDITREAVDNTEANIKRYNLENRMTVYHGDVFNALSGKNDKFDLIFWNFPFGHINKPPEELSSLERAIFDPGYVAVEKYMKEARDYLAPNGHVFLGFSPTIGYWDELVAIASKYYWSLKPFRPHETLIADIDNIEEVVAGQRFEIFQLIDNKYP
ncbi:unnamed protein product [Rotaria sp. Silwood2]|nr:unnamed protein product [Rotaria sp. Silwood2]CAF3119301.1 unnamed protein product [Rotaria sp. Silwood2]CAF3447959.1 unnamed protein product [Rotaria sp. Silwood2]CAF4430345.1 unnamed protein product [Rotaria sp. Silwood2]CAF4434351.1 unnamed protein product [Rotaria sp. Silwood2]